MLKIGQIADVVFTGYTSDGLGVCRVDSCAVFVPNAIRGERCLVQVTHVSKNSAHGKIEQILERSPHRISRTCPDAKRCGGCQYHHMDYEEERFAKAQKVADALTRLGGQDLTRLFPGQGSEKGLLPITGADGIRYEACGTAGREETDCRGRCATTDDLPAAHLPCSQDADPGFTKAGTSPACPRTSTAGSCMQDKDRMEGELPTRKPAADPGCFNSQQATGKGQRSADAPVPDAAFCYRNKAQYPLAVENGKPVAGFYKNRTHQVVPVQRCAILPPEFDLARDVVLRWAAEDRVSVYDESTGTGLLRHIYLRKGVQTGQLMVCIVANGRTLPRQERLIHALRRALPGLVSVILSVNRKNTNVVLGEEFRTLWGQDEIEDVLCGFTFRLSPRSFYQVNHDQAQRLYERAVELAGLTKRDTVLDLYCGTGTITLALSRQAGRAIGVEVIPQAIADAKENARRNGVENVEFFCADAGEAAKRFCAEGAAPDVILVDPPRKGLAPEVIEAIEAMAPKRLVYVSCDPATLARDVKLLSAKGYNLQTAEAFDLFPRTFHVETVVSLSRK